MGGAVTPLRTTGLEEEEVGMWWETEEEAQLRAQSCLKKQLREGQHLRPGDVSCAPSQVMCSQEVT